MQPEWEVWFDCNLSPVIAKWLADATGWTVKSAYSLQLYRLTDFEIYQKAKEAGPVILVTKDTDLSAIVQQKGAPPKVISIKTGNCDNRLLWQRLQQKLIKAVQLLQHHSINTIEIE